MPATLITVFPVFLIVMVAVLLLPMFTLPNVRFPLSERIRVGTVTPVPEAVMLLVPLVWFAFTVTAPVTLVADVGLNVTTTV